MSNDSASGGFLLPDETIARQDADFDLLLQGLVVGITALPQAYVRPRWQMVPTPMPEVTKDWCAIGVISEDAGYAYFERHDGANGGTTTAQTNSTVRVLASFYGPHAKSLAQLFRDGVMVPQNREYLFPTGIALQEPLGPVRNVPELVNEQWRLRSDAEFVLRVPNVRVWPIRNIKTAQGTLVPEYGVSTPFAQDIDP